MLTQCTRYLVLWDGYSKEHCSWVDVDALTFDCKQVIIHVSSSCMSVIFILLLNCTFTLYIYGIMIMLLSSLLFF